MMDVPTLLAAHAALPEPYQPAWGLKASRKVAQRGCEDRLAVILPLLEALPCDGMLRILDLGCAQGYFTLAIAHALAARGRAVEVVGVDYLKDNVSFCRALAAHHGIEVRFVQARFDTDFFAREPTVNWDVVLALNVLHHVQQQQGALADTVAAVRKHTRVLLCELAQREEALEWVGDWPAADEDLLSAFAFRRRLARFSTHLGDVQRPLYACSGAWAWIGTRWFPFDRVAERSHAGVPDAFAGQRRFFFGGDVVIKSYRGDGQHGAFNRAELEAEITTLAALHVEPDRYPEVLAQNDDGDTVWLVRGSLPGRLLSECIDAGDRIDRTAVVRGLLGELAHLEASGFHHGDLRCWNVLVHDGRVRLIDYGAMSRAASPLHRVALAALLREIADGKLRHTQPFYASLQPLSAYPAAWRGLVRYLLETPQQDFGYADALDVFDTVDDATPDARLAPAGDVVAAAASEQIGGFERIEAHMELLRANRAREMSDAAAERALLQAALVESQQYGKSLRCALDESQCSLAESQEYVEALRTNRAREMSDAAAERAVLQAALVESQQYGKSLGCALDESQCSLAESQEYVEALRTNRAREMSDAAAERGVLQASLVESRRYVESLRSALEVSERARAESQHYVESLLTNHARELTEAATERDTLAASGVEAAKYADALRQALAESQRQEAFLRSEFARLRSRFRWLRPLWPRASVKPKGPP